MSQQINLYNPAFIPKREVLTAKNLATATAVLYLSLAAAGTWAALQAKQKNAAAAAAQAQQKQMQEAFETVKRAAEARKPSPVLQAEIARSETLLTLQGEVLDELDKGMQGEGGKAGFSEYLRGLARQARVGLWLTGFTVTAGGEGMQLRGRTTDKAMLPEYIRRLNAEPAFAGKSFASLQMGHVGAIDSGEARTGEVMSTAAAPLPTVENRSAAGVPPRFIEFQLQAARAGGAPGTVPSAAATAGGGFSMTSKEDNPLIDAVVNSPLNPAQRGSR